MATETNKPKSSILNEEFVINFFSRSSFENILKIPNKRLINLILDIEKITVKEKVIILDKKGRVSKSRINTKTRKKTIGISDLIGNAPTLKENNKIHVTHYFPAVDESNNNKIEFVTNTNTRTKSPKRKKDEKGYKFEEDEKGDKCTLEEGELDQIDSFVSHNLSIESGKYRAMDPIEYADSDIDPSELERLSKRVLLEDIKKVIAVDYTPNVSIGIPGEVKTYYVIELRRNLSKKNSSRNIEGGFIVLRKDKSTDKLLQIGDEFHDSLVDIKPGKNLLVADSVQIGEEMIDSSGESTPDKSYVQIYPGFTQVIKSNVAGTETVVETLRGTSLGQSSKAIENYNLPSRGEEATSKIIHIRNETKDGPEETLHIKKGNVVFYLNHLGLMFGEKEPHSPHIARGIHFNNEGIMAEGEFSQSAYNNFSSPNGDIKIYSHENDSIYSGIWNKGAANGKTIISRNRDRHTVGFFENGLKNGKFMQIIASDSGYLQTNEEYLNDKLLSKDTVSDKILELIKKENIYAADHIYFSPKDELTLKLYSENLILKNCVFPIIGSAEVSKPNELSYNATHGIIPSPSSVFDSSKNSIGVQTIATLNIDSLFINPHFLISNNLLSKEALKEAVLMETMPIEHPLKKNLYPRALTTTIAPAYTAEATTRKVDATALLDGDARPNNVYTEAKQPTNVYVEAKQTKNNTRANSKAATNNHTRG